MSLYSMMKGRGGPSGFGVASTAEEVTRGLDLHGRTILITGVNSGVGAESARVLSERGARILGVARTLEKARGACEALVGEAIPLACELSEPSSVRACVKEAGEHGPIDVLMCNAGIMALPERTVSHGQELQFLTNHIGHFILVTGLLGQLTANARVVMLSSGAHRWAPASGIQFDDLSFSSGYKPRTAYGQSKLANVLFARALARRFEGSARTANAVHPGVIRTNLVRHMPMAVRLAASVASSIGLKSIPEGAATQCYVATHPSLESISGEYFADSNVARSSRHARDDAMGERLWQVSEEMVAALA